MLNRTTYYVSIENKMLEKTKVPGQAELEISATEVEVENILKYMNSNNKNKIEEDDIKSSPKETPSASYTPSVGDNENNDRDIDKLVDLIYKLKNADNQGGYKDDRESITVIELVYELSTIENKECLVCIIK